MNAYIPLVLIIARAFLLVMGIVSVNMIIVGGFEVMLCGGRDEDEHHGMEKIFGGVLGSLMVFALFTATSVAIRKLGL